MKPPFLTYGDKIAIVSPSGNIDKKYIDGAVHRLTEWSLTPVVGEFATEKNGRFAGTPDERLADLQGAIDDKEVKAILCSRGGYGLIQILDALDFTSFEIFPKWLIGFSDITLLHNAATAIDVASIHSIMARPLAELPDDAEPVQFLHDMLFGTQIHYTLPSHPLNRTGKTHGTLVGGNLSILSSVRGTHFDVDAYQKILFLEDVAEAPYRIERMMYNLKIGGVLENLTGLVVGQFTDYIEDPEMGKTVYEIIADSVADYDYPVCFNFPAGHVERNLPLMFGAEISFSVGGNEVELQF
jgi:muramoyltetrapeptide carboxypeptidase